MRTNAPAALRQVWTDVRMQLGLLAVESIVVPRSGAKNGGEDLFTTPWRELDSAQPAATKAVLGRFLDGLAAVYAGNCTNPPCDKDIRSSVPFKISRADPHSAGCACCRRLFDEEDTEGAVNEVLVVPRLTSGHSTADHVLVFCSGTPLSADEARFLHTAAGLYFAQQTIWESGQREEPIAALRPREIECVRWAVTGKTLGEIAEIMGLSYRTVRFHLDSARARYGFSTNQQLFVQAAKDYGLDPEGDRDTADVTARREKGRPDTRAMGRMQPVWAERRDPRDRRSEDRRRAELSQLPFPDRRGAADRRTGQERRAVVQAPSETAEQLLTPEEIRALLN